MSKKNKNAAPDTTATADTTATPKRVGRKPMTAEQKADALTRRTLPELTKSEVFYNPVLWAGLPVGTVARLETTLAQVKAMRAEQKAALEKALAALNEVAPVQGEAAPVAAPVNA